MVDCTICHEKLEHPKTHRYKGQKVCSKCFEIVQRSDD